MKNKESNFLIDALKYLPIKVLPAATGLLTIFILTKSFSENNYINYTFIITSLLLVNQLYSGWLNSAMMYFIPKCSNTIEENKILSQIFIIQFFLSIIGVITILLTVFLGISNLGISLVSVAILLLQITITFLNSFLQSKRLIKAQIVSTTLQSVFQIISLFLIYYYYNNLVLYLIFFAFSFLVSLISLIINRSVNFKLSFKQYDKKLIISILSYGLPLCVWFFSAQFYAIGDRLLLKYLNVSDNVVNYVAFKDLSVGLSGFISMPLLFASHPIIMNLVVKENKKEEAIKIIEKNINILLLIFLPCILVVFFYGDYLLQLFLSSKYILEPIYRLIILLTVLVSCISIYLQKGLEVSFKTKYMLKISLLVALLSLLLNLIFIPFYSVYASVFLGLFCQLLYMVFIYKKSSQILKLNFGKMNITFFVSTLLISIVLFSLKEFNTIILFIIPCFLILCLVLSIFKLNNNFYLKK